MIANPLVHIHTCFMLIDTVFMLYLVATSFEGSVSAHRYHEISASTVNCSQAFTH